MSDAAPPLDQSPNVNNTGSSTHFPTLPAGGANHLCPVGHRNRRLRVEPHKRSTPIRLGEVEVRGISGRGSRVALSVSVLPCTTSSSASPANLQRKCLALALRRLGVNSVALVTFRRKMLPETRRKINSLAAAGASWLVSQRWRRASDDNNASVTGKSGRRRPWNKSKLIRAKPPLGQGDAWSIRTRP